MSALSELKAAVRQVVKDTPLTKASEVIKAVRKVIDRDFTLLTVKAPYELYDAWLERTVKQMLSSPRARPHSVGSALAVSWSLAHKQSKPLGDMTKPDLEEASAYHTQESKREQMKAEVLSVLASRVPDGTLSDNVAPEQVEVIVTSIVGETAYARRLLGKPGEVPQPGAEAARSAGQ